MAEVSILQLTNMISYLESWKELRVNRGLQNGKPSKKELRHDLQ